MRTQTTYQSQVLSAAPVARTSIFKIEIDRTGSGSWVDITSYYGLNWVREVTIDDTIDQPTMTASVTLERAQYFYNASPLMAASLVNSGGVLVNIYRKIRISAGVIPLGMQVQSSDYVVIFTGRIYQIDWSSDALKIDARDFGGDLMDCFIETNSLTYGSDTSTVLAEAVMQSILTSQASLLPAAVTLYSINGTGGTPFNGGDSPAWAIKAYKQDLMPTMTALQTLAQQIGWLLKYRWNTSVGDYVLTWYDPVRSNTTSLHTFTASQYYQLTECSLHLGDIRNAGRLYYYDTSGQVQSVVSTDSTSISNYGRKYIQIAEEATSQIRTSTDAQKMIDGAISDLALPVMTHTADMPFFWPVETGDIYTFSANGVHYDSDQKLAVFGYRHTLTNNKATTSVTLRGKPSGGVKTWFDREVQQVRKSFGVNNMQVSVEEANQCPNGTFVQYSRG